MSENLSILDGELRRQFAPVDRLSVDNQGGGVSPWVISDFLDISTLSVSENGLYLAAEEEYDCYEEVEVDISEELGEGDYRRITGKDPNLDPNNDYAAGLDENGNLTKEMIPAAIHIVVPPRKRKYEEGETLDFTGIHVYLMDGNNKRYTDASYPTGEIPFDELVFPITVAGEGYDEITEGDYKYIGPLAVVPNAGEGVKQSVTVDDVSVLIGNPSYDHYHTPTGNYNVFNSDGTLINQYYGNVVTAPVKFYYRIPINKDQFDYDYSIVVWKDGEREVGRYVYTLKEYDSGSGDLPSGESGVPVQWMRSDGEILEDTFEIEVGESEEGEEQPDPWGGYADVSYGGHHYNLNRRIVPEVHYANGYCWQEGTSEYTVEQAASMGWLILIR